MSDAMDKCENERSHTKRYYGEPMSSKEAEMILKKILGISDKTSGDSKGNSLIIVDSDD